MVIGMIANTLKLTHVSVDTVRQTTSLSTARNVKKHAQRSVSLRHPSSFRRNTSPNTTLSSEWPMSSPANSAPGEQRVDDGRL